LFRIVAAEERPRKSAMVRPTTGYQAVLSLIEGLSRIVVHFRKGSIIIDEVANAKNL
jgi:hypothetical protein